jgi:hypothetical protein
VLYLLAPSRVPLRQAQGKLFDKLKGKLFDKLKGKLFDKLKGKLFDKVRAGSGFSTEGMSS